MAAFHRAAVLKGSLLDPDQCAGTFTAAQTDTDDRLSYEFLKRIFDLSLAIVILPFLLPIMALIAPMVLLNSPGPALFVQRRLAKGGKVFNMYKFRTMRMDAEAASGAVFAENNDPRLTALGSVLRKYRLDELPQIFNVISGEMSFIGPRPERPEIAVRLAEHLPAFYQRLAVKPGITGLAQITVGYASCIREYRHKLALDIIYVKKRSIMLDLKIAVKTLLVIIGGEGAR